MPSSKPIDLASLATVVITLVLFGTAVFVHGLTQHLLLEAGVFLVSVKLILMSYKNGQAAAKLLERLDRIENILASFPERRP